MDSPNVSERDATKPPRKREPDFKFPLPVTTHEEHTDPIATIPPIALPEHLPTETRVVAADCFLDDLQPYLRGRPEAPCRYEADGEDFQFFVTATGREEALPEFERAIEAWEDATGKDAPISFESASKLAPASLPLREVYDYWLRRRQELQHPLWRKYWKTDLSQDPMVKQVFNQRKAEKMRLRMSKSLEENTFKLFWRVRDDLEEVLDIMSCVEARERLKLQSVELEIARQEQVVGELLYPEFQHPHADRLTKDAEELLGESRYLRSDQQYLELLLQPKTILDLTYARELPTRSLREGLNQAVADLKRSLEDLGL